MIQCKKCDVNIPKARSEMGYDVCVGCSTEQKKVGHVIYPHKTGAFIQVMDRETRDNLDRLDRRGITSKTSRHYKTIVKKSKDLDKTAKVVRNRISSLDNIKLIPNDKLLKMIMDYYEDRGYHPTIEYLRQLNRDGDIALKQRADIQDLVVERYLEPSSRALQRRFNER
jgi:hypothetical protein